MNTYEDLIHRLSSKVKIRSLFKDLHLSDVERIIERCKDVYKEKVSEREEKEKSLVAKRKSIEEVRKILDEKGLSVSDLENSLEMPVRRRNVQKFVFEFKTLSGDTVQWEGTTIGRLPKEFQSYLYRTGKKRLDCVVENL